jgi:hypothetical protein
LLDEARRLGLELVRDELSRRFSLRTARFGRFLRIVFAVFHRGVDIFGADNAAVLAVFPTWSTRGCGQPEAMRDLD